LTALEVALAGRWEHWWGLEPGLDPAELAMLYPPVPGRQGGGVDPRYGDMLDLRPPNPLTALRVWSRDGRVVLVELEDPLVPDSPDAALLALGQPQLTQPARFTRYGFETTDHVYPARGAVLVTAQAYDHGLPGPPPDTTPRLARAELFVPTDLAHWQQQWRHFGKPRPPLTLLRDPP
jgi:hypothetical protein